MSKIFENWRKFISEDGNSLLNEQNPPTPPPAPMKSPEALEDIRDVYEDVNDLIEDIKELIPEYRKDVRDNDTAKKALTKASQPGAAPAGTPKGDPGLPGGYEWDIDTADVLWGIAFVPTLLWGTYRSTAPEDVFERTKEAIEEAEQESGEALKEGLDLIKEKLSEGVLDQKQHDDLKNKLLDAFSEFQFGKKKMAPMPPKAKKGGKGGKGKGGKGKGGKGKKSCGKPGKEYGQKSWRPAKKKSKKGDPEFDKLYADLEENNLLKYLGRRGKDYNYGPKHRSAYAKLLCKLDGAKPSEPKKDEDSVKYIPNLPAPPKAIKGSSDDSINEKIAGPEIDYAQGTGPLAKLAAEPSGTRTKPAKGSIWGKLNVRQVKQAMTNRKRFGLTNTPDEQLAVIVDPEFIDYFGLSVGEASKAYKDNTSRASSKDTPTGKDRDKEIEDLKATVAKLTAMIQKGGKEGSPKAEKVLAKKLDKTVKRPPVDPAARKRLIKRRDPMHVDVFRKAQRFYKEASWPMDEGDMAKMIDRVLADGQAGLFHDLYNVVLKEKDALDRIDVGQELVKAGLSELAIDFRDAVLRDQAKFVGSGLRDPYSYREYADQLEEANISLTKLRSFIKETVRRNK